MSLTWNSETWAQVAAHAARVAAHLKEREEAEAISSELNIEVESIPSSSSSFVDLSIIPEFAHNFDAFPGSRESSTPSSLGCQVLDPCSLDLTESNEISCAILFEEKKKNSVVGRALEKSSKKRDITRSRSSTSSNCKRGSSSSAPSTDSRIERIRQNDREKKRLARNTSGELIRQLDNLLQGSNKSTSGNRTLHEILAAASAAVRCNIGSDIMRSGMLSQRSSGMLVVDALSLTVLDANAFVSELLGVSSPAECRQPLSTFLPPDEAAEAAVVLRHLARGRFRDATLRRFVLGLHFSGPSSAASECLPTEFVRCSSGEAGTRAAGRDPFVLFVSPLASPVDTPATLVRALLAVTGFRDGETVVLYRPGAPPAAWSSATPVRRSPSGPCSSENVCSHNGAAGNDLAPFAAAWALDFLMRGVREGDWGGLREWLRDSYTDPACPQRRAALHAMDMLAASAGAGDEHDNPCFGIPGTRLELRAESGFVLFRLLLRGLCLFEFHLDGTTLRQSVPFPLCAQHAFVEGAVPLEELYRRAAAASAATGEPSMLDRCRVRADGAVWVNVRPSAAQLRWLSGPGGPSPRTVHVSILFERDRGGRGFGMRKNEVMGNEARGSTRLWTRAGPGQRAHPEAGGVEARNALLSLCHAMRSARAAAVAASRMVGWTGGAAAAFQPPTPGFGVPRWAPSFWGPMGQSGAAAMGAAPVPASWCAMGAQGAGGGARLRICDAGADGAEEAVERKSLSLAVGGFGGGGDGAVVVEVESAVEVFDPASVSPAAAEDVPAAAAAATTAAAAAAAPDAWCEAGERGLLFAGSAAGGWGLPSPVAQDPDDPAAAVDRGPQWPAADEDGDGGVEWDWTPSSPLNLLATSPFFSI